MGNLSMYCVHICRFVCVCGGGEALFKSLRSQQWKPPILTASINSIRSRFPFRAVSFSFLLQMPEDCVYCIVYSHCKRGGKIRCFLNNAKCNVKINKHISDAGMVQGWNMESIIVGVEWEQGLDFEERRRRTNGETRTRLGSSSLSVCLMSCIDLYVWPTLCCSPSYRLPLLTAKHSTARIFNTVHCPAM